MDEGFTARCNQCGKETIYTGNLDRNNDNIKIMATGYGGEVGILCECGSDVSE